jgi:hypothetical protein
MWEEGEFTRNIQKNDENWRKEYASREQDAKRRSSGGGSNTAAGGGGILAGVIIFGVIWFTVADFLEKNWVSLVIIAGIIVACIITCLIIRKKIYKSKMPVLITIAVSIGLIVGVIALGMAQKDGNFERWKNNSVQIEQRS